MVKRTVLSAVCAASLLVAGAAYAQTSATLTLRSGEKVNGDLIDLGGVGYTIRVSGNGVAFTAGSVRGVSILRL